MEQRPSQLIHQIIENIEKVIIGKRETVELVVCAIIAGGHVLIEDKPGVGKTSLVNAIAKSVVAHFKRIQFTPDTLPTDIVGFSMYNPQQGEFVYQEGAVMTQILLADEINRTNPKTQSALLEAMEEKQVTVDGTTYKMPDPFIVFATQNPVEQLGTHPLPEAQLDRFLMRVTLGYPSAEEELKMLSHYQVTSPLDNLTNVTDAYVLSQLINIVPHIQVTKHINKMIIEIINATRNHPAIVLGASPRASLALQKAAQAWALYEDRTYVTPDDVLKMVKPILAHRLLLSREAKVQKLKAEQLLDDIVANISIPNFRRKEVVKW